jgi:hypothetical protein
LDIAKGFYASSSGYATSYFGFIALPLQMRSGFSVVPRIKLHDKDDELASTPKVFQYLTVGQINQTPIIVRVCGY